MKPLNYFEYKKDFDTNVHVRVFKAVIKVDSETMNQEIVNLFNLILKDNSLDKCNNYM
jgi:hypothetical protein